jgi:hypothetical protein
LSGLFERALAIRRKVQGLWQTPAAGISEEDAYLIPIEEQEEILGQISQIVAGERAPVDADAFVIRPQRRGVLFPVLTNLFAVLIIGVGGFLLFYFYGKREETIATTSSVLSSTEGRLLAALKEESEQLLADKDQQISQIQDRLSVLDQERALLQTEMQSQVNIKEQELRDALAVTLEEERARLQEQGLSSNELEEQLRLVENERRTEFDRQLQTFREQSEADLAAKEEAIASLKDEFQRSLETAQTEQQGLQEKLIAQTEELADQQEEESRLKEEYSQALTELEEIRELQQKEQLVLDQILSSYASINEHLQAGRYSEAREDLDALKNYTEQESVAILPAVAKRRPVETFLIASLSRLIDMERSREDEDTKSLIDAANLLTSVASTVSQAETYYREGDAAKAEELFLLALKQIPDIELSTQRLEELTLEAKKSQLARSVIVGDGYFAQQDYQNALNSYAVALSLIKEDTATMNRLISRVAESGYQLRRSERLTGDAASLARVDAADRQLANREFSLALSGYLEALESVESGELFVRALTGIQKTSDGIIKRLETEIQTARSAVNRQKEYEDQASALAQGLETVKERYSAFTEANQAAVTPSQEELLNLLQAKLQVRELLDAEEIRASYPALYEDMDLYIEAFGENQLQGGRRSAMEDAISIIEAVISSGKVADSADLAGGPAAGGLKDTVTVDWSSYDSEEQRSILTRFLEAVRRLLE